MPDSDKNKDGVTDMAEAVAGGAEHMAKQAEHVKEVADREAARVAESPIAYPREFSAHTRWVDATNDREFVGTQYSYDTEQEALGRISQARAHGKYVMYSDLAGGSFVMHEGDDDWRVIVED